jgi:hypothetical protein
MQTQTPLVLGSTKGGQVVETRVHIGNATRIAAVAYGPSSVDPRQYLCAKFGVRNVVGKPLERVVNCTTVAGVGAGLVLAVQSCTGPGGSSPCFWVNTADTFAYPKPVYTPNSLHHKEGPTAGNLTNSLGVTTTAATLIGFNGQHFGNDVSAIGVAYGQLGPQCCD